MSSLTNHFLTLVLPDPEPTQAEIEEAVKTITLQYPHIDPLSIADTLYQKLQEVGLQLQLKFANSRIPQPIPAKYFDFHNYLKRMIAKSYYYHGYGYDKFLSFMFKQHASFHIDQRIYTVFSQGMVLQLYRGLEKKLIRNKCKIKLKHKNAVMELNEWILYEGTPPLGEKNALLRKYIAKRYDFNEEGFDFAEAKLLYSIFEQKYKKNSGNCLQVFKNRLNGFEFCPQFNFDQLLNENHAAESHDLSYSLQSIKPNSLIPQASQNELHYQNCDPDQLNFDMDSAEATQQ